MSFAKIIKTQLTAIIVLGTTCVWSQEKIDKLPKGIVSTNYTANHYNGVGRTNVLINEKLFMSLFWTERWTGAKASDVKTETVVSNDKMQVTVHSTYKWANGLVDETRIYTNDSIKVDYTYTPVVEKVKTSKINLYFKFYDLDKENVSYTEFGGSGGLSAFKDIAKGKKALCSSLSIKDFAQKDIEIATDTKNRIVLEEQKSQAMAIVAAAKSWRQPYTQKGQKYNLSLVYDFVPAEGQEDIEPAPLKVTY